MKCPCIDSPFERFPINVDKRCLDCPVDCGHDRSLVKKGGPNKGVCIVCALEWAAELWEQLQDRKEMIGEAATA